MTPRKVTLTQKIEQLELHMQKLENERAELAASLEAANQRSDDREQEADSYRQQVRVLSRK